MGDIRNLLESLGVADVFDAISADAAAVSLKHSSIKWRGQPLIAGGLHYYRSANGDVSGLVNDLSVNPIVCQTLVDSFSLQGGQVVFVRDLNVLSGLFEHYAPQFSESCFVIAPVVSLGPLSRDRASLRCVLDDLHRLCRKHAINGVSTILVDVDVAESGGGVSDSRAAIYNICDGTLR